MQGILCRDVSIKDLKPGDPVLFTGERVADRSYEKIVNIKPRLTKLPKGKYYVYKICDNHEDNHFPICIVKDKASTNMIGWIKEEHCVPLIKQD